MAALPRFRRRTHDPANDRLATAVFVAALVHGLVIMGVKFSAPAPDTQPLPTLEILLVPTGPDDRQPNDEAAYLAQRTQKGSGTSEAARRTKGSYTSGFAMDDTVMMDRLRASLGSRFGRVSRTDSRKGWAGPLRRN